MFTVKGTLFIMLPQTVKYRRIYISDIKKRASYNWKENYKMHTCMPLEPV